jgi:hypothetical protein
LLKKNLNFFYIILLATRDASDSDSRGGPNASDFHELNRGIRREVGRLSERWTILLTRAEEWQRQLDEMLPVKKKKKLSLSSRFLFPENDNFNFHFKHFLKK